MGVKPQAKPPYLKQLTHFNSECSKITLSIILRIVISLSSIYIFSDFNGIMLSSIPSLIIIANCTVQKVKRARNETKYGLNC